MQLTLDERNSRHLIQALGEGQVRIDNVVYTTSVIVTATQVQAEWPVQAVADLDSEHWAPLLAHPPQILILGTGARLQFPTPHQLAALTRARVGVEVMDSAAACRTFNVLLGEGRDVAAAIMLTGT